MPSDCVLIIHLTTVISLNFSDFSTVWMAECQILYSTQNKIILSHYL